MTKRAKKADYRKDKRIGTASPPSGYYDKNPLWAFRRIDAEHQRWGLDKNTQMLPDVLKYLKGLESQTWRSILTDTSGRADNTRNHAIGIDRLCKDAQKRAEEIKLDEFDELVSIAISGTGRVWGVLLDGVYYIVWFDPQHEVYPVTKQHT